MHGRSSETEIQIEEEPSSVIIAASSSNNDQQQQPYLSFRYQMPADQQLGEDNPVSTRDLIYWSFQIARGMDYLVSKKVGTLSTNLVCYLNVNNLQLWFAFYTCLGSSR